MNFSIISLTFELICDTNDFHGIPNSIRYLNTYILQLRQAFQWDV